VTNGDTATPGWDEANSRTFIELGRVYTPRRDELLTTFLDLVPFAETEAFTGVELGTGSGWLTAGILRRFPHARMIGLDGSAAMREAAAKLLAPFAGRVEIAPFRLEDQAWREALPAGLGLAVSSLVIHHLAGAGKQQLFRDFQRALAPGGALLICDVVEPANEHGRRQMARAWDAEVRRQSLELTGSTALYEQFVADRWNMYAYPEPADSIDHPSTLVEQLGWLADAGFTGIDAWWARAGHVLLGGYRT
jgi:tRNA (cmo5U34)-methyltransferase